MTTTLELKTPINVAGGKEGGETITALLIAELKAGHLWDIPAQNIGARHTLSLGCMMAGYRGDKVAKVARALVGLDIKALTIEVNAAITVFQEGAERAVIEGLDPAEPHTIQLRAPVKMGKENLTELTLQPLKGADVWDVPASGVTFGHILGVGASQCGTADAIIKKLSAWDAGQLLGVTNSFLADFHETGE